MDDAKLDHRHAGQSTASSPRSRRAADTADFLRRRVRSTFEQGGRVALCRGQEGRQGGRQQGRRQEGRGGVAASSNRRGALGRGRERKKRRVRRCHEARAIATLFCYGGVPRGEVDRSRFPFPPSSLPGSPTRRAHGWGGSGGNRAENEAEKRGRGDGQATRGSLSARVCADA